MELSKTFVPIVFDDEHKQILSELQADLTLLEAKINKLLPSRERSLALTELENTAMWITKAIRKDQTG